MVAFRLHCGPSSFRLVIVHRDLSLTISPRGVLSAAQYSGVGVLSGSVFRSRCWLAQYSGVDVLSAAQYSGVGVLSGSVFWSRYSVRLSIPESVFCSRLSILKSVFCPAQYSVVGVLSG